MALTYKEAGVDVAAGEAFVRRIAPLAEGTRRPEVLGGLGGFGGLFALPSGRFDEPVLVGATDGVGTKLKLAFATGRHDTVGIDLVAMCVNDVLVVGAEPLFFLDYFATGRLDAEVGAEVVRGIAEGCRQAGCALLGGETAEMPGFYRPDEYDLAGFAVGVVERARILDGSRVKPGDLVVGLASSGLHSNGFSLARRALEALGLDLDARPDVLGGRSLGEVLLEPTRIYVRPVLTLLEANLPHALAHVTGGGLPGNLPRVLPPGLGVSLDATAWPRPPIFDLIASAGIEREEMYATFNMGLGMVAVVDAAEAETTVHTLERYGVEAFVVGEVRPRRGTEALEITGVESS
ncbi:MAG: phosphoribosylformylglycinamidine cyclo-ligase [Deltaproteobacteria bacterium]|nr:MAG: phosphoribosylformylglycinamidine cyclo-ligase [Deltaproteobacteria bacterium]